MKICTENNCRNKVDARGLCNKHYLRYRAKTMPKCSLEGCIRNQFAKGYCSLHNNRLSKKGYIGPVGYLINHGSGKCISSNGYMRLHKPGHPMADKLGWVKEHRYIAYEAGLLTGPQDRRQVHHKDGNKLNNSLSNLEVISQSDHMKIHASKKYLDADKAASLRMQGLPTTKIGEIMGANPGTIWRVIRRWEIENKKVGTLVGKKG